MNDVKTDFQSNTDLLCYIKLKNGQEILAEVSENEIHTKNDIKRELTFYRPLVIQIQFDGSSMPRIMTFPFISPFITDEESCTFPKDYVLFLTNKVNDMMKEMYFKNWEQLMDEAYVEDEAPEVDEEGNPLMTDEQMESLPATEEIKKEETKKESIPTKVYEGKKRTIQ